MKANIFANFEKAIHDEWSKDNSFKKSVDRNRSNSKKSHETINHENKESFLRLLSSFIFNHKNNKTNKQQNSNAKNGTKEYVFFDGPPFANGLPHYGHLLTGYIKDVYARYHTMKGELVERRFGWDCHGLPAEMSVEKKLVGDEIKIKNNNNNQDKNSCNTINNKSETNKKNKNEEYRKFSGGRQDIKDFGIENFNNLCRQDVIKYTNEWREYVTKQGRWVDFDNDYKTMELPYMESVMWAFSELYKKGLIYEDYRVMPYSWKCQTPVSNFETRMDNAYRQHESKSVYLKFKLKKIPDFIQKAFQNCNEAFILAWTTTPWTLPSNLALAVNKDIQYTAFEADNKIYICAEQQKDKMRKMLGLDNEKIR